MRLGIGIIAAATSFSPQKLVRANDAAPHYDLQKEQNYDFESDEHFPTALEHEVRGLQWTGGFDPTDKYLSSDVKESKVCNEDCLNQEGNYFCRDFFKYDRGLCCTVNDPLCRQEYDLCSD